MENNDIFLKFKKLLGFVFDNKYSDFYRVKYEKVGFNPVSEFNSIDDLKKIPFLAKKELLDVELFKLLFVDEKKVGAIAVTSGTTGKPLVIFYHESELYSPPYLSHLTNERLRVFCLHPNSTVATFVYHLYALSTKTIKGPRVYVADASNLSSSCQLAEMLKTNFIYTLPSLAIILKNYFEHYPNLKKSLKFIMLIGELVSLEKKKLLENFYPNTKILLQYSSSEGPAIGFQCQYLSARNDQIYYHVRVDDYYLEIINPETEEGAKFGEKGELVITNFWNSATPLIRYKTGDLVSFVENNCPCGAPGHFLQIWGRVNYDVIKAGGFVLRTEMLEKPLLNLKDCLQDAFECHVYENFIDTIPKVKIKLNLSLKNGFKESPELKRKIENEFLKNWQLSPRFNLKKAVETGLFDPPQINFIKFSKSVKPRKILILHQS